ncbi:MAG TPA: pyruvate, phosphate dikinase [Ktedonobacterales bacterium]|nr:pyruvate, phosphate dikinase [Ktedonobacterales bacterium]
MAQTKDLTLEQAVKQSPRKWVYLFAEGNATMRDLLGGKGAGVAEMTNAGLPVPPGFTITTEACNAYYDDGKQFPKGLWDQAMAALRAVEHATGKRLGDVTNPLLVSVRSGAKFSMPGMMDTVLNLGLNDETVQGVIAASGDERFAYDAYRRFIQMFSKIVLDAKAEAFEHTIEQYRHRAHAATDADIPADALKRMVEEFKNIARKASGRPFPEEPYEQLKLAIEAVFASWNNKRAIDYRNFNKIDHHLGTAVNVQTMVFGNLGTTSATGVAFTRNPSTGAKELYGDYLVNAQGEDVVAGIRNTSPISHLRAEMPEVYKQFNQIAHRLEAHYRDVQDLEFTIEHGKLYMLQTRAAKRTAAAAVKAAVDMVREKLISEEEAIGRVTPEQVVQLLLPRFDEAETKRAADAGKLLARGVNASPGAAVGKAILDADRAEAAGKAGEQVILVRQETSPDDVHGMLVAKGVLTSRGGTGSHAAVVARGLGLPAVVGCEGIRVDYEKRAFFVASGNQVIHEGDEISIDGTTGSVYQGAIPTKPANFEQEKDLQTLLGWADRRRKLGVWANADYPRDAERAVLFGAEGIGLCRTEHMFMEQERLPIVQEMILAATPKERKAALDQLLPFQRADFEGIFRAMRNPKTGAGYPVVIRLIDPPLHEFLPSYEELLVEVTKLETSGKHPRKLERQRKLLQAVAGMREMNPMLGLRGCRLGLLYPEINVMQTRAILEAAAIVAKEGIALQPKIMIPLVGHVNELREVRRQLEAEARVVAGESGGNIAYKFGTMIELPRAALTAGQIAEVADFFSFGTNDLTQTTFGMSRDDAEGKFLLKYVEGLDEPGLSEPVKILPANPFQTLDRDGVGRLIRIAVEEGRKTNKHLEVGICGEHGGDPDSIAFCNEVGLDYVSCSPFRVAVARLAAAQAALAATERDK